MSAEITDIQRVALDAIHERMGGARDSGAHKEYEWAAEPVGQHLMRAAKHCITAYEMLQNYRPQDAEGIEAHLRAAVTRSSMGLGRVSED